MAFASFDRAQNPYGDGDLFDKLALRRGDDDRFAVHGGAQGAGGVHVANLKALLVLLRIEMAKEGEADEKDDPIPEGKFSLYLDWAVREFQIYAKAPRYLTTRLDPGGERLIFGAKTEDEIYKGPVHGACDAITRAFLELWFRKGWICPVIIHGFTGHKSSARYLEIKPATDAPTDANIREKYSNIWFSKGKGDTAPRMFVRDFSGLFEVESKGLHHRVDGQPVGIADLVDLPQGLFYTRWNVLGDWAKYQEDNKLHTWHGPSAKEQHVWQSSEMTPDAMVGAAVNTPGRETARSTYKVVRACAEGERLGFFDGQNAYDGAAMSVGPCHWTLALGGSHANRYTDRDPGELGGTMSYARAYHPRAFAIAFERFGLSVDRSFTAGLDPGAGGSLDIGGGDVAEANQLKYIDAATTQVEGGAFRVPDHYFELAEWARGWHWFYRFAMAGRVVRGWRRTMWDMARVRLRDVGHIAHLDGAGKRQELSAFLTSEAMIASLLRFHIWKPSHVVMNGVSRGFLKSAITKAAATQDPAPQPGEPVLDPKSDVVQERVFRQFLQTWRIVVKNEDRSTQETGANAWWRVGPKSLWGKDAKGYSQEIRVSSNWPVWKKITKDSAEVRLKLATRVAWLDLNDVVKGCAPENTVRALIDQRAGSWRLDTTDLPPAWWSDDAAARRTPQDATGLIKARGFTGSDAIAGVLREFQIASAAPLRVARVHKVDVVKPSKHRYDGWIGAQSRHEYDAIGKRPHIGRATARLIDLTIREAATFTIRCSFVTTRTSRGPASSESR